MEPLRILACFCAILFGSSLAAQAVPGSSSLAITEAELVRRTQEIYDSIPKGDPAPWKRYYAEDAMVYDEKGRSMDKGALLADVAPMPAGYGGTIKVVHPHAIFAPGVAILAYECEEVETIFGQELRARYHSVDTWLNRNGSWQIAASQTMRYYEDPAVGSTDVARLDEYTGTYELSPGNRRRVVREGDELVLQRPQGAKTTLLPESGDLFFRRGVEGRILFHRDSAGKVDALYDRRNNEDVVWKRVP